MYSNLDLSIGIVKIPVHIHKLTDPKTTLNTIYEGRRVRTCTVLTHGDVEKITSLADIETVVDRNNTERGVEVQGPDGTNIVKIDKDVLGSIPSTRNLSVIAIVPTNSLKPYQFGDASYEITVHGTTKKKVKIIDPESTQMMNILYHGLTLHEQTLIGRYVSFGSEKFCAIYPATENPVTGEPQQTLVMTTLTASSYFRTFTSDQIAPGEAIEASLGATLPPDYLRSIGSKSATSFFYQKIIKSLPTKLEREAYTDKQEMMLRDTITKMTSRVLKGEFEPTMADVVKEVRPIPTAIPVIPENLRMLMSL